MKIDARVEAILEMIVAIGAGNLDWRIETSEADDEVDAIASGLNMLAEELSHSMVSAEAYRKTSEELRRALDEVKTLRAILPICMYCKKVNEGDGRWERLETHLENLDDIALSHGCCEDCMAVHYPQAVESGS